MSNQPSKPRDWSGIGCAVFLVAFVAFFIYARQPDPDRDLVRQRENYSVILVDFGATLTPADASHPADPQVEFSPRRLRLGDKPYYAIKLPYRSREAIVERTKELFPEVVEWSFTPPETSLVRLLGSAEAVDVVRHADRVEAQRLKGEATPHDAPASLAHYPPRAAPFPVPPQLAERITRALLDPDVYYWGGEHICLPEPGVRLTWHRGDEQVDVLFCFGCGILDTYSNERPIASKGMGRAYNDHAAAMKELFPDDEQIQGIKLREKPESVPIENITPATAADSPETTD